MFKIKIKQRDTALFLHENSFIHMQHTDGRSADYKLYINPPEQIDLAGYEVWSEYGRIGTKLKLSKIAGFTNISDARKFFIRKVKEQLKKGYSTVLQRL